jgi:hypothetical protein
MFLTGAAVASESWVGRPLVRSRQHRALLGRQTGALHCRRGSGVAWVRQNRHTRQPWDYSHKQFELFWRRVVRGACQASRIAAGVGSIALPITMGIVALAC